MSPIFYYICPDDLKHTIMILSTTPTIEGHPILAYKGIVTGESIIGANFVKDFFAGIRDIIGGRSGSYEQVLREGGKRHCRADIGNRLYLLHRFLNCS